MKSLHLPTIAAKAFALGGAFVGGIFGLFLYDPASSGFRVALYIVANSTFHMLEFLTTALYNPGEVDTDSFILEDKDLYVAFVASVAESVISHRFWSYSSLSLGLGLVVAGVGQTCRSVAMCTAGESFNHYVQRKRAEKHQLVTAGIYRYLRHPSYFGYFWWFVGNQLILGNWIMAVAGAYKLHQFFRARIEFEEEYLRSFFGKDYEKYAAATAVGIPGIA